MIGAVWTGSCQARSAENHEGIAVIIGNKTYAGRAPTVEFAHNDAAAMRRFVIDVLGFRPGNIIALNDATLAQLRVVFGTERSHTGKLSDWTRASESDVFVFYSSHGVPGLKDRRSYLLPTDGDANRAEATGYPMDLLLGNLAKIDARSMTVMLDACFSGDTHKGVIIRGTSGITVAPKSPAAHGRMTVLTAARHDQVASWDIRTRHGLFTEYVLRALYGAADKPGYGDGDGKVTLGEIERYLDREMTYSARRSHGRDQRASIIGNPETVLASVMRQGRRKPVSTVTKRPPVGTSVHGLSTTVLEGGLTLGDWVRLAQERLEAGDYRRLLAEAAGHRRKVGPVPAIESVVERAVAGMMQKLDVHDVHSARKTLFHLEPVKATTGETLPILAFEARAHHLLSQFDLATAAYAKWLRTASLGHPDRRVMATGLSNARKREPLAPPSGTLFKDCRTCPEMVVVPHGKFMTGKFGADIAPGRLVEIERPLAVGRFEVTFAEWDACVADGGCNGYRPADRGWGRADHPVINVSWRDTVAYTKWLSRKTGRRYRLLTETEWEYAARGTAVTRYWWGNQIGRTNAICDGCGGTWDNAKAAPVGALRANRFKLHDTLGNVAEWVADCWTQNAARDCHRRVVRGGSWKDDPSGVQASARDHGDADQRTDDFGFRVARSVF